MSADTILEVKNYIIKHKTFFPKSDEKNLVHGDFDPSNIFVQKVNNVWQVSGILDWEFAYSGSYLNDVANMLRYAHKMPKSYADSFLQGLTKKGITLPNDLQKTTALLNIAALLEVLSREHTKKCPNKIQDIKELLKHFCNC